MNYHLTTDGLAELRECVTREMAKSLAIPSSLMFYGEYRNPFDFIQEFDEWFEFEKRKRFGCEPTKRIIAEMLADDIPRAMAAADTNYTMAMRAANDQFGRAMLERRSIFFGATS